MRIESYFSSKHNLQSIILEQLDLAQKNIFVAVAWFTDNTLFQKLIEKQEEGVHVELIITKHEFNINRNNFEIINGNRGLFLEVGDANYYMHNKFCVIDYQTVINGSFNWTLKANNSNKENITIITGNNAMVADFLGEFESIKKAAGLDEEKNEREDLSLAFNYFKLFKAYLGINEPERINPFLHDLKAISSINHITNFLLKGEYQKALIAIDEFINKHSQIINISEVEKAIILSQIKLLSHQIELSLIEKEEIEGILQRFNRRYIIELNPLILKVLSLKKKIYEKLKKFGLVDESFEQAEEEFKKANNEYNKQQEIKIPELNKEEALSMKEMHREAVRLCHPDSPKCIFEDKKKAAEIFSVLTEAYKQNNIEKVKEILDELRLENTSIDISEENELELLKAKLSTLKIKYEKIIFELGKIKLSDSYQLIKKHDNWDAYFTQQKELLEQEFNELTEKYTKNEQ